MYQRRVQDISGIPVENTSKSIKFNLEESQSVIYAVGHNGYTYFWSIHTGENMASDSLADV